MRSVHRPTVASRTECDISLLIKILALSDVAIASNHYCPLTIKS
jgi:hypothetical protein